MKTSKLITILKSFSDDEIKRFQKFINSPYHNSGRNLMPLFRVLKKYHPEYPSGKLNDEKILKALKMPFNRGNKRKSLQLRVRFSELTKLAENFIVTENSLNDKYLYSKILAEFHVNRGNFSLCRSETNECIKILTEKGLDESYSLERLLLQRLIALNYSRENKITKSVSEIKFIPLYAFSYFITNVKVQLFSNVKEYPVNYNFLKFIVDNTDVNKLAELCEDDGTGLLYKTLYDYKRCQFYLYEKTGDYLELLEYYRKNFYKLSRYLKWQYFLGLMRSGTTLMNKRDINLFGLQLNLLIDFVFENGVVSFKDEEPLEDVLFTTIIRIKFAFDGTDKIIEFSEKYIDKVKPELKERVNNYLNAFISFKNKGFNKSLSLIQLISNPSSTEKNSLHKLKIAALYETGYIEEFYYAVDNYIHFLANNTRFNNKGGGKSFIEIIKKLQSAGSENSTLSNSEKEKLTEESKTSEFYWWLKEKIEEL